MSFSNEISKSSLLLTTTHPKSLNVFILQIEHAHCSMYDVTYASVILTFSTSSSCPCSI